MQTFVCAYGITNSKYSKVGFKPIVQLKAEQSGVNYYESRDSNCIYNMLWKAQRGILENESYKSGVNLIIT